MTFTPLDILVLGGLAVYVAITVFAQLPANRITSAVKRRDAFAFVPAYTFFAPNPGVSDYVILYRDELQGGGLTACRTLYVGESTRCGPLWNPAKRRQKLVTDLASGLLAGAADRKNGFLLDIGLPARRNRGRMFQA